MKKLILTLLLGGFALTSCQKDDLSSVTELDAVEGRGKAQSSDWPVDDSCYITLTPNLPATVNACVTDKGLDAVDSYFNLNISDTYLAGDYDAWCVDQDATLDDEECFVADVYSSYETLPAGEFEQPENFPNVNWLVNQDFIGQESPTYTGEYFTFGDIQRAIWYLVDDSNCTLCEFLGPYSDDRAQELRDLALANGGDYEPGEGDELVIILIPQNDRQSVIITIPVECQSCETAFAYDASGDCFIEYDFSRWGWTIPISEGNYVFDVYAGAGQCDLSKGTKVGTVSVSYSGNDVDVDYDIMPGYNLDEEHTYAGLDPIPSNPKNGKLTLAPGQYRIADDLNGEDIYVILHTVICGDYED